MKLAALAALAFAAAACGGPKQPVDPGGGSAIGNTADPATTQPHEVMATLERTACYGVCPIYKLVVYRDGTVEYSGERFVKQTGEHQGQMTPAEVEALDRAFADAHYFDLKDAYTDYRMTDMPSATTSYTQGGRTKTIEHYHGDDTAPEALSTLEDKIDELAHSDQFVGTREERDRNNYYRNATP